LIAFSGALLAKTNCNNLFVEVGTNRDAEQPKKDWLCDFQRGDSKVIKATCKKKKQLFDVDTSFYRNSKQLILLIDKLNLFSLNPKLILKYKSYINTIKL
jgi:hypothetical protein